MMYCQRCGQPNQDAAAYCVRCGNQLARGGQLAYQGQPGYGRQPAQGRGYQAPQQFSLDPSVALPTLIKKMRTSALLWTILGIFQVIIGIVTLFFGYGIAVLILGIWNLVQSGKLRKNAALYRTNPIGIVSAFQSHRTTAIVFIFVNLFLGALIGVIGSIYDLTISNYVLNHQDVFLALERRAQGY